MTNANKLKKVRRSPNENNVIQMQDFRQADPLDVSDETMRHIQRLLRGINEDKEPLKKDLIERFQKQSQQSDITQKHVLVQTEVGKVVSMSPEQAYRFKYGVLAEVLPFKGV